jgi:hypothetical protein
MEGWDTGTKYRCGFWRIVAGKCQSFCYAVGIILTQPCSWMGTHSRSTETRLAPCWNALALDATHFKGNVVVRFDRARMRGLSQVIARRGLKQS